MYRYTTLILLAPDKEFGEVLQRAPSGRPSSTNVARDVFRIVSLEGQRYGLGRNGLLRNLETGAVTQATSPDRLEDSLVVTDGRGRICIVSRTDARIVEIHPKLGERKVRSLTDPETLRVKDLYAREKLAKPGLRGNTVLAAAMDAHGNLLLMLSGFKAEQGAPVMVLGPDYDLIRTLRIPVVHGTDARPRIPLGIASAQSQLFVLDSSATVSAYFL